MQLNRVIAIEPEPGCPLERFHRRHLKCFLFLFPDPLAYSLGPSFPGLNQLHAPQIMQVQNALDAVLGVDDHEGSDFAFFQECQCLGSEFVGADGPGMGIHGFAGSPG